MAELHCPAFGEEGFEATSFLKELASEIQMRLRAEGAEVAHLKMTLNPEGEVWVKREW